MKFKQWLAGIATGGVTALLLSGLLPLDRLSHWLICLGAGLILGGVVGVMAGGLDTSKEAPVQRPVQATGSSAADRMIESGLGMTRSIRDAKAGISDPVLVEKITRLETVTGEIIRTVSEKPEKAPQVRRFMEYYLPTVVKMLDNYRTLDERGVTGENAERTRQTVRDAMDVVIGAFKKQHDQLYQENTLDVTSDYQVLSTMLKQDGLLEGGPVPMGQAAAQAKK